MVCGDVQFPHRKEIGHLILAPFQIPVAKIRENKMSRIAIRVRMYCTSGLVPAITESSGRFAPRSSCERRREQVVDGTAMRESVDLRALLLGLKLSESVVCVFCVCPMGAG